MGKSLRSKSHLKAKSIKRKNVFQKIENERIRRISDNLKQDLINQKIQDLKAQNNYAEINESSFQTINESNDKIDEDIRKIRTSGWRDARHHTYKKAKKMKKVKKGSFTKF